MSKTKEKGMCKACLQAELDIEETLQALELTERKLATAVDRLTILTEDLVDAQVERNEAREEIERLRVVFARMHKALAGKVYDPTMMDTLAKEAKQESKDPTP